MDIRPIRTDLDYIAAVTDVARLMELDPPEGSDEFDRMDVLATLVEAYEARAFPIGLPHPVEAIEVRMTEMGITRRRLCSVSGISEGRLSEIMSCKRPLSLNMIRIIGPILRLPTELLVKSYPVEERQNINA